MKDATIFTSDDKIIKTLPRIFHVTNGSYPYSVIIDGSTYEVDCFSDTIEDFILREIKLIRIPSQKEMIEDLKNKLSGANLRRVKFHYNDLFKMESFNLVDDSKLNKEIFPELQHITIVPTEPTTAPMPIIASSEFQKKLERKLLIQKIQNIPFNEKGNSKNVNEDFANQLINLDLIIYDKEHSEYYFSNDVYFDGVVYVDVIIKE